ncbi:MAG TPA: single-stranded-DNA-specific exonuclease RecJ, partial [Desulfobacteraceae bacterium]|nr:single-stranded-DNA-specific exonuclease RecJ [Desulfobacteraceae bacterium]
MKREWEIRPADPQAVSRLSRELSLPEMLARLLVARGLSDLEQARAFLLPRLADLADPSAMKGMDAAVERLLQAGRQGERITIWGDYDVDGVTSVSLLLLFLRRLGFTVDYYIPSRLEEGYGLNSDAVQQVIRQGTQLLVTVDCGIS